MPDHVSRGPRSLIHWKFWKGNTLLKCMTLCGMYRLSIQRQPGKGGGGIICMPVFIAS